MSTLLKVERESSEQHINTAQEKKDFQCFQWNIHMIKGDHVYNSCTVRSLQRQNNYFKVKIGHPLKVKLTVTRGKKRFICYFWGNIFLCDSMSIFACPSKILFKNCSWFCILCSWFIWKIRSYTPPPSQKQKTFSIFLPEVHLSPALNASL